MGFRIDHSPDATIAVNAARATGRGQRAMRQQEQDLETTRFLLGLQEQQRESDLNLTFRAQQAAAESQRYQDQLGAQQQFQAAQLFDRDQARQAALAEQAMQGQFQSDRLGMQQGYDWQQDAAQDIDGVAADSITRFRKMNLDPEGKRLFGEYASKLNEIRSQRSSLRPEVYNDILGQWLQDVDSARLDSYEVQEPTPDELWQQKTRTSEDGTVYGLDRNGMWRKLRDPAPRSLAPEEITGNTYTLPNGVTMFVNPLDGKPYFPSEPKQETGPKQMGPLDYATAYTRAFDVLHKQALAAANDVVGKSADGKDKYRKYSAPDPAEVRNLMQQMMGPGGEQQSDQGVMGQAADLIGGMFGGQDGPPEWYLRLQPGESYTAPDGTTRIKGQ
jgi:hypothetical protein